MGDVIYYNFAEQFSKNPGLRFRKLSDFSGEQFREEVLEPCFQNNTKIIINVDGVESSLGASFLSEAFGDVAVKYTKAKFDELISFKIDTPKGKVNYEEMLERVDEALKRQGKL